MHAKVVGTKILVLAAPMLLLAACEMKIGKDDAKNEDAASVSIGEDGNVQVSAADGAKGVSIDVPGFSAKVNVPGMNLGSDDMDIDGMKLYPGTRLAAVNVNANDANGTVDMHFTASGTPTEIADYYAKAAQAQDFTDVAVKKDGDKAVVSATKPDGDLLTIALAPATGGTAGQIRIIDAKKE